MSARSQLSEMTWGIVHIKSVLPRNAETQFAKCDAGFEVIWLPHRAEKQPQAKLYGEIFQVPGMQKRIRVRENVNTEVFQLHSRSSASIHFVVVEERSGVFALEKNAMEVLTCIQTWRSRDESSACPPRQNIELSRPSM